MNAWWAGKAWPWLKKNWQWVLVPIGVLLFATKLLGGRRTTVVASELTGAAEVEREAEAVANREKAEATKRRLTRLRVVKEEHAEAVKVLTKEQAARVDELLEDPEGLNSYLLDVGKQVRDDGGSR